MIGPLGAMLFSIFAPMIGALYGKAHAKTTPVPAGPTVISPQVTGALKQSRKRYAQGQGRQSTLLTGGIYTTPSLLKQGLVA